MLSEDYINFQRSNLIQLGNELQKEADYSRQIVEKSNIPKTEKEWFNLVLEVCIHGIFIIQNVLDTLDKYKDKNEEQIGFYIGKAAIYPFLELINAYELSMNQFVLSNQGISSLLHERIKEKTVLIEDSWREDVNRKSRNIKKDIINNYQRKSFEMKFIRDTLVKHEILNSLDCKILDFCWDIRNSMHLNFTALKDIEFSAPGTSLSYNFNFKKGEDLYHPKDLVSFFSMAQQIIFIHHKTLQHFRVEQNT